MPGFAADIDTPQSLRGLLFSNHGWRLSHGGRDMLKALFRDYDSSNDANTVVTGKILLNMDQCCGGPWALRGKTVTVWDPTVHFELQMVGGNLRDFVDFKGLRG